MSPEQFAALKDELAHVTLAQAAELLGISARTLYDRVEAKDPAVLALGAAKVLGRWRFPVAGLRQAFEDGRTTAKGHGRAVRRAG